MSDRLDLDDWAIAERQRTRREHDLSQIPEKITILARDYFAAGGDPGDLHRIITDSTEPPTE